MKSLVNNPAISADGVQVQYIGPKERKHDAWCGSNLTWQGPGDVQLVRDPKVAGKLLSHDDVWRLYDPDAPLPSNPMQREAEHAAATGDVKTLLASLQMLLGALGKTTAGASALEALGLGAPRAPAPMAVRLAAQTEAAVLGKSQGLADHPLSAPPQPEIPEPPAAPASAAVPNIPVPPRANVNERELLMENLRREAKELNIQVSSKWGPTALSEAISVRRAAVLAAAESQAAATAAEAENAKPTA